jgi:hypothetical protein
MDTISGAFAAMSIGLAKCSHLFNGKGEGTHVDNPGHHGERTHHDIRDHNGGCTHIQKGGFGFGLAQVSVLNIADGVGCSTGGLASELRVRRMLGAWGVHWSWPVFVLASAGDVLGCG